MQHQAITAGHESVDGNIHISAARRVFGIEAEAIASLARSVDQDFAVAVSTILRSQGRTIVCGMGKSGIIGKKIAATLASTGTPSFFLHPGEAYHGDLGMVTSQDNFVAISFSGETEEVVKLLPFLRDNGNFLVAMTGCPGSTLAQAAHCHLNVSVSQEACPLRLAPTSSTTATLAMGDALAVALMESRGFKAENFARFHPGGALGKRLLTRVEDELAGHDLPYTRPGAAIMEVLQVMTRRGLGLALVPHADGIGVITDGDIRRAIESHGEAVFQLTAKQLMTPDPCRVACGTRVEDALALMDRKGITSLLVYAGDDFIGVYKK